MAPPSRCNTRSTRRPQQLAAVAACAVLVGATTAVHAFTITHTPIRHNIQIQTTTTTTTSQLHMGLFDGVKEAFAAPALERSAITSERETPIDRWMGWSVVSENNPEQAAAVAAPPANFVDAMDETNYVTVELVKPMGIVFEENDAELGGIFVQSLKEGGAAALNGVLQEGDQLVAVNTVKVAGMPFEEALGTIVEAQGATTKLVLFRGPAKQFYGPTGASAAWLDDFVAKKNDGRVES